MTSPARQVYNEPERMSVGLATQTIEDFVADLLHKPPVVLVDNVNEIVGANIRHQIRGAVFGGRIYIVRSAFADGDVGGMRRTLWHELLHYGLRRFLTEEEYTAKMLKLYSSDLAIRSYANNWAKSSVMANKLRSNGRSDEYIRARGVDEALAWLAERVGGTENGFNNNGSIISAYRKVTTWLAGIADSLGWHDVAAWVRAQESAEARQYVHNMLKRVEDGAAATSSDWGFTADPAFSNASTDFLESRSDYEYDAPRSRGESLKRNADEIRKRPVDTVLTTTLSR